MLNSTDFGKIGEVRFLYELTSRGIQVSIPYGNSARYDMIADFNGKLNRIQIKTTSQFNDNKTSAIVKCTSYTTRLNGVAASYVDDVDYIGVFIPEWDQVLLIPISIIGNAQTFSIRKEKNDKLGGPKPHYLEDFVLDKIILN